jgi:hypothetical protein
MTRLDEIKAAIEQRTRDERCELAASLNPFKDAGGRQMKRQAEPGGKLNRLMETVDEEYEGKSYRFPRPSE